MADTEASPYIDLDGLKRAVSALDRRYSAAGHRHATSDVEGLDAALDGRAPLHHAHHMREVVGLTTALAGKADGSHAHSSLAAEPLDTGADLDALDMSRGDASVRLWSCYGGTAVDGAPDGETGAFALACELLRWSDADDFASRQTYVSASGREWQRCCASGEWTAWRKVYTSGDMPTPAEIGAADRVHAHAVADVTGLRAELDGKAASEHGHVISDVDQLQATLDAKAPGVHQHQMADVTGLSSALAGKSDAGHLHAISDVVNLGLELQGKSPVTHGHDAATQTAAGFLSATDKAKLDRVADGATRVTAVSQIANDLGFVNSDQTLEQTLQVTADMATKTWVEGQDYQSGAEVSEAIASAVSTGTADMATRTWVEQQGYQDASQVDTAIEAKGYDTAASVDSKVSAAKAELQGSISQAVASVLKWQGAVATVADLPETSTTGYVYHVDEDGGEYAWDGEQWVELGSVIELTWEGITGKPTAFPPSAHVHAVADTTGLQAALDAKAASVHTHPQAQVEGLTDALAGKAAAAHVHQQADVTGLADALAGKAATGHKHSAADVTSGTLPLARGGTGATTAAGALAAIGAASAGHTHAVATASAAGFMSLDDKQKLDGIAAGANRYVHPAYTAHGSGLYKVAVDSTGHVSAVASVTKSDITALGIPGAVGEDTDTTYTLTKSGSTIKLTGSDGSETSVTDSNTTYTLSSFGVTATAAELNYVDGVTSGIQSQLNGKAAASHTHNYAGSSSAGGAATSADKVNVTTLTSQNLNDYRTPGTFFAAGGGNTCTNKPSGVDNFGMFVIQSAGGWQTQFLYGSNDVTYTRAYHGGTWTSWVEMYTSANKPTASEIGAAALSHSHAASAITSGTLSADRLPTVPIAKGGTGSTSASAARTALGITPANIGAAASSHSHQASQVTGLTASRALVSDSSGHPAVSAVTATELGYLDGVTSNVQTQLNGKAASSHSHSYLPLSGGTMGADAQIARAGKSTSWVTGRSAALVKTTSASSSQYVPVVSAKSQNGSWDIGPYTSNILHISYITDTDFSAGNNKQTADIQFTTAGGIIANTFTGALSGNATTATTATKANQLTTARTLTIGSTGKSFNGTANVSWSLSEIGAAAANHTHSGYAASSHNHSAGNITSGTLPVARGGTGVTSDDALRQKVLNFPSNSDLLSYLGM